MAVGVIVGFVVVAAVAGGGGSAFSSPCHC